MARERTPARARSKPQLGDSWIVESDGDDEYTPPHVSTSAKQAELRKRISRPTSRVSAEPELIMPSMKENGTNAAPYEEQARFRPRRMEDGARTVPRISNASSSPYRPSDGISQYVKPVFLWMYDVLGGALHTLKTPISCLIALWILIGLMILFKNLLFSSFYTAISPICHVPGVSLLNLPICQSPVSAQYAGQDPPPVQFDQLMIVQNKFDEILQESADGVSLPLDMKRGETSIRDLRQVVRYSHLRSKNELVLEFDGFIETARIASFDLQKFNSHVGRGVDNILATARWTKRVLDGIAERDASRGAKASFFSNKVFAPFQPLEFTEDALLEQYLQHTRVVEDEISRLVVEAQALLLVLQNLEDRLDVIHGIALRDDLHAQGGKDEVLSQLWTMLGGNRSKLGKFDSQLRLLDQVNTYRQNAIAHVGGTLLKLQSMGAELEELRERVGSVELLGGKGSVPLSLHIENIELGVERLERGRMGAKELEHEELRKTLDRGNGRDRMIDGL